MLKGRNQTPEDETCDIWGEKHTGWESSRVDVAEENVSKLKDTAVGLSTMKGRYKKKKKKGIKHNEKSISDLRDNFRESNVSVFRIPKEAGVEK